MEKQTGIKILCVGLDPMVLDLLSHQLNQCKPMNVGYDIEKLMEPIEPAPSLIFCGQPPEEISTTEIAQMLSMQYQGVPLLLITFKREGYNRKLFVKNGFTDAFVLPLDLDVLKKYIEECLTKISKGTIKSYRSVKLIDIEPGVVLDFDVSIYLASNNRYVRYSGAGDAIDQKKLEKLGQHKMSAVYVTTDQMSKFYQYTAERLKQLNASDRISATEKKEKLESSVRDLMIHIFNDNTKDATFDQGQGLLQDCKQIVNSYILNSPVGEWYQNLLNTMGEKGSNHGHSGNVSTYAAMFSIGLGIGEPADLAIAGLFHDIGLADVPVEILQKDEKDRTREGQEIYKRHPEYSINILKCRKLILSETVTKAILQHHENFNGTGYPAGLAGPRISKEAQILALADRFDYLTNVKEGKSLMTPVEALEDFRKQIVSDPGKMIFDPELLKQVLKLFPQGSPPMENYG